MDFSTASYEALIANIFQRFPSVQRDGFSAGAYKPGLDRMQAFDRELGYPSRQLKSIHVAGTNGKGSVSNMLASAFCSCGYKTGLFTSPHILDFRERMRIDGEMIPKEYVSDFLQQWLPWISANNLSFFEITTGLAFKWFADSKVDMAVIEVGLGGRLDSTNILTPVLSVVTTIGLDHCDLLGDSLAKIAAEKAGIFKTGVQALVGETQEETAPVFTEKAWMFCPLTFADKVRPSLWEYHAALLKQMDLQAPVQAKNLRTVLAAIDLLKPDFEAFESGEAVMDGIVHTAERMHFHGRWEKLSEEPYVLADIGHYAQALAGNFQHLQELVDSGRFSSLIIVYGVMADKDLDAILPLMPEEATYIFTAPQTRRALPAHELLERFKAFRGDAHPELAASAGGPILLSSREYAYTNVRQAVQMALQIAHRQEKPLIYIGGSTFVVAEALPLFH